MGDDVNMDEEEGDGEEEEMEPELPGMKNSWKVLDKLETHEICITVGIWIAN